MVVHRSLVEVGILAAVSGVEERLREFEHVVGVARFGAVALVDVTLCCRRGHEPFVHRVAADADGAVGGDVGPEVACGGGISRHRAVELSDALKADVLGHLRVGMTVVEERGRNRLHAAHHRGVAVFLGTVEIFGVVGEVIGIGQDFVHAAVLRVEHALHGVGVVFGHEIYGPVAHLEEHREGLVALTIYICVAQAGHHLVLHIEGHIAAGAVEFGGAAAVHIRPKCVVGIAADVALEALCVGVEFVLTILHDGEHVVHALLELRLRGGIVAGGISLREGREIVSAHMTVETEVAAAPVLEVGVERRPVGILSRVESGLTHEGCEQTVHVVGEQHVEVAAHSLAQRSFRERHLREFEVLGVELVFGLCRQREDQSQKRKEFLLHGIDVVYVNIK